MINIWFYAFVVTYIILMVLIYKYIIKDLYLFLKYRERYIRYFIIDTGETKRIVFKDNSVKINNVLRVYNKERIINGTLFYESSNSEPINIIKEDEKYTYFCDTKEFLTLLENTLLERLILSLETKRIQLLVIISIFILIVLIFTYYLNYTKMNELEVLIHAIADTNTTKTKEIEDIVRI